ncbi:putative Ig domain-containing protein [Conexibacter stalactiti]|uniref:Ig domain-containing protein n=1 Tax=Conexibacter stalactiti TaxID=1940611 RepID=A0ABU4HNR8_9ACTN|nr:putative Ig domain-containing protein [Conexibacter stalactiti]MDW5594909.1 putative Ig domain-containing protein [Conexibacter stalactiti]MEC5035551.1 putative Ig domain-containing protein [Conexibacter stalactiti]
MTGQGRLTSLRRGALAAGLLLATLLAWSMQRAATATAAPAAAPICAPADCPATGAPQSLTFGPSAAEAQRRDGRPLRPSVMHVSLHGGPRGSRPVAIVTGPHGRRWRISRDRSFFPRVFGRWTVTGQRIVRGSTVTFPKFRTTNVQIRRGGRGTVAVRWVQVVSNRTRVAQESAITRAARANGGYTVTLSDPSRKVGVGDTLASGPTKATPQGLLITVATVKRDGETATVTGPQAPLSAIGPQARITVRPQIEVGPGALGARASAQPEGDVEKPYKCEGGVSATVKGTLGLSAGSEIGISWGGFWHPLTIKAIAVARLQQSSRLALRVSGKAKCELDVDLLKTPIRYSPITFAVGPVPVVITPKLNFHVIAEGSVEGAVETTVRQALDARVGLEWDGDKLIPVKTLNNSFSFTPPEPEFNAGIMAGIGPKLMFDVYEAGGPYLTAEGLIRFDVDSTRTPWWRLSGGFQAGAGIAFKVWRFSFDRNVPDLFSKDWTIAQASGSAPPQLSTSSVANATAGAPYGADLAVTGGTKPFTWTVTKGALPAGLTLNPSTGRISGTPTVPGSATFTITVTDAKKKTSSRELRIVVAAPPASVTTATLPDARLGVPYVATLQGAGSTAPYTWSVTAGTLPAGITLDGPSGTISGVPTALQTSAFTVAVQGRDGQRATRALSLKVDGAALALPAQTLADAVVEAPYTATLRADGGIAPLTWAVTAGALPAGLTLAADGKLSGTATAPEAATFTVTVTDATGAKVSRELTLSSVYPALSVGDQSLLRPMAGQPYSGQLRATGGGAPITWAITAGTLPDGLTLPADGSISGTATTEGDSVVTVTATDKFGQRASKQLTLTVVPNALEVLTETLPRGRVSVAYSEALEVRGGRAPYTWTRTSGSLPSGLTLATDGTLSGTPSASGSRSFTVQVRDADGVVASGTVSIAIAGNSPQAMRSVTCPTSAFCAAADLNGGVVTWDGSAWGDRELVSAGRDELFISCGEAGECLAVDTAGKTYLLRAGSWTAGPDVTGGVNPSYVKALSCPTTTFCQLAAQSRTNGRASIYTWDGTVWSAPREFSGTQMTSVECLSPTDCVAAIGSNQTVMWWNGAIWSTPENPGISWTQRIACTTGRRCVANGTFGDFTFLERGTWGRTARLGTSGWFMYAACARNGDDFCAYGHGDPAGRAYAWGATTTTFSVPNGGAVACYSSQLCVVTNDNGHAFRWDGTEWRDEGVVSAA